MSGCLIEVVVWAGLTVYSFVKCKLTLTLGKSTGPFAQTHHTELFKFYIILALSNRHL